MKTNYGWFDNGNGENSSGFSGLPGEGRRYTGNFYFAGLQGVWWSSSPYDSFAWKRYLSNLNENVGRYIDYPNEGYSVRCIQDAE